MNVNSADYLKHWVDCPENPLIEPPPCEFLIADPSVVTPDESPDPDWHLFANSLLGIHHYTSADGVHWGRRGRVGPGFRPFVLEEDGVFYMFFERFTVPQFRSHVAVRSSKDLWEWDEPVEVLRPTLGWEGGISRNTGNPCVVRTGEGYRLYYSAGVVFLPDLGFCEPLYIGAAHAFQIAGPYRKEPEPIIAPSENEPYRNLGAGAIKVIEQGGLYYGFNNGIYRDPDGRTRSAIEVLSSDDGLHWEPLFPEPVIRPEGTGWKKALVYQLDVKRFAGEFLVYYNARSGWRFGKERIGLATSPL